MSKNAFPPSCIADYIISLSSTILFQAYLWYWSGSRVETVIAAARAARSRQSMLSASKRWNTNNFNSSSSS